MTAIARNLDSPSSPLDAARAALADAPCSVWVTAQASPAAQRKGRYLPTSTAHPGKMLPAIARHAIDVYTKPGDTVLDPMCGIGTTLVEATHLGRHAIGVELEHRWAQVARGNVMHAHRQGAQGAATVYRGDARDADRIVNPELHGSVNLLLTSPPYGASLHGQVRSTRETGQDGIVKFHDTYGTSMGNLAHAPTDELLDSFTQILRSCRPLLADGATVAVTARPWREHGELVDLPAAVVAAGQAAGLVLVERCVALLAAVRDGHLQARPSFFQLRNVRAARAAGIPMSLIVHEDLLCLRVPSPRMGCPPAQQSNGAANAGGPLIGQVAAE
ncbi:TRM11 family SAM-dependent methyltransferase [Streptacidiphilus neutrinimicus]|uniref:TRM11 family SAM-dependent methyltransferase n=1 Tax=Streptacidiphilus neutrinimicus TaxID=105420 RepID=UPI000693B0B4|nr:DNA methyltransferase [Streptacidiphilus neutrinimicus]